MQSKVFNRRIYTLASFLEGIQDIFAHLEDLSGAVRDKRISHEFSEKIMLAVSQVNGCRYCLYGHSRAALAAGVDESELQSLLAGELGSFPPEEAVALTFAQHYAESKCQPEPEALQRLHDYYGPEVSRDIRAYLRMISFGNLLGNTFDAFLSRLCFRPVASSSIFGELAVLCGAFTIFPVGMFFGMLTKQFKRSSLRV